MKHGVNHRSIKRRNGAALSEKLNAAPFFRYKISSIEKKNPNAVPIFRMVFGFFLDGWGRRT